MISQAAKALVTSLLNSDPTARPSLDAIANHNFFKSGYFPREIPISATKEAPSWPGAGSSLQAVSSSRAEWRRNYEEVARAAGVGIDSAGKPIQPVGADVGKPPEPVPVSRPQSVASDKSNECADIGKLLEKKKKEQQLKDEALKANGGYILPEALSPRDGHARMRNMGVLKRVPSRLGPLRTAATLVAQREAGMPTKGIPEDEEDSDEEMEDAEPVPPPQPRTRQLDKQPIRRSSADTQAVTAALESVQLSKPVAPQPRRNTRSHAAQQRAASVPETAPPVAKEDPPQASRVNVPAPAPVRASVPAPAPIRANPPAPAPIAREEPPAPQQPARRLTTVEPRRPVSAYPEPQLRPSQPQAQPQPQHQRQAPQPQVQPLRTAQPQVHYQPQQPYQSQQSYQRQAPVPQSQPQYQAPTQPSRATSSVETQKPVEKSSSHPDSIPFGSTFASRVGKPIPETSLSATLQSLEHTIENLQAFTSGNIRSLSPTPAATIAAVRAYRSGSKNKAVFIKKWVDYTNKYGMAYMLSDGTCATLYNDNTSFVVDDLNGEKVEWITHSLVEPERAVRGCKETVFRRLATEMSVIKARSSTSKGLKSKLMIWRRTSNYMNNCLGVAEHWACNRSEAVREPSVESLSDVMLWVTLYARLRRCVVFRLLDGTLQVCSQC